MYSPDMNVLHRLSQSRQSRDAGGSAQKPEELREAAREFESIFARRLFSQMNRASALGEDKEMATDFYRDMLADRVADVAAQRGELGIARLLERAWGVRAEHSDNGGDEAAKGRDSVP